MYIAFDVGNVLVSVDFEEFFSKFSKFEKACYSEFIQTNPFTFIKDIQKNQDIGIQTLEAVLNAKFKLYRSGFTKELVKAWNDSIKPNDEMLNFINNLKERGIAIAILSNMGSEHAEHIREQHSNLFEGCILHLSSEVGARKPTKLYYQSFLMQHPEFRGCLFLDDLPENLLVAEEFGFKGIHFELNKFVDKSAEERAKILSSIRVKIKL